MPAVLKVDPQRRIVLTAFYGSVSGREVLRHQAIISTDPYFQPNFADVVDLSSVSVATIDDSVLTTLAATPSIFGPDAPHVIVAPADLPFEIALKYQDISRESRPNLHVVRTLAEARQLLHKLGFRLSDE